MSARDLPPFNPPFRDASFLASRLVSASCPVAMRMTCTALPITSAGRFWPWGPLGMGV